MYEKALEAYEFGHFEQVDSLLKDVADELKGESRVNAYRLLALSNLNMDKQNEAEQYVAQLLSVDPYYKAYNDAPRFADMVEGLKAGKSATITTASQQAESIEEAPVPVTLITEEMIQRIGARTVKDVLLAYVPGMTDIACNEEMNIAMRGVFSSGQEKILFLLNGHRLNSYSTNAASPDYSMSLEKVKQIEVLRGPASSIYGGVALTGVVNIITKEGSDVDGVKVKGTVGNYGQLQGDFLFGKRYMGLDVLVWGNLYNSTGEKRFIEGSEAAQPYSILPCEGNMLIGAYNRKPTYDLGLSLRYNTLHLLYNRRFAKTVSSLALSSGFTPYSYEKYLKWNGNAPGNAVASQHIELGYSDKRGNFSWTGVAFFDSQSQQRLQVVGDTVPDLGDFTVIYPYRDAPGVRMDKGGFQCVSWDEYTTGVKVLGGYEYHFGKSQRGSILLGGEYNHFTLNHSSYFEGVNYYEIIKTFHDEKELQRGEEEGADVFLQVKHFFGKQFLMNAGIRYDYKKRRLGKTLNEISPRLAFIYNNPLFQLKMSYARSFVDAPYFYRSNTLDVEYGWEGLQPEILNSFQFSLLSNGTLLKGLLLDVNLFYNNATDFITYDGNMAFNAGKLKTGGVELVAKYNLKRLMGEVNCTMQTVISEKDYDNVDGKKMLNIPPFKLNAILSYEFLKGLSLYAKTDIATKQSSAFISLLGEMEMITVPARCLFDAGGRYRYRTCDFSINVHNLLNHHYVQGGSSVAPMMQQGRWFTTSVAYKF
ncbi:MAG: TonB-dependent receptor plug domain-containing protein [Bacteroidaceae bacterium]|nr:TonB-dependent receptor plug domain-containing protein [Bacteroidaceae bacterium]